MPFLTKYCPNNNPTKICSPEIDLPPQRLLHDVREAFIAAAQTSNMGQHSKEITVTEEVTKSFSH